MKSILVYSPGISNRLQYIVNHIFYGMLKRGVKICSDADYFRNYQGCKINYSHRDFTNCLKIVPHRLLFRKKIRPQTINFSEYNGIPICFQTGRNDNFPFDIFAASFYFLSRYEEYLVDSTDVHQRFDAKDSLAYKNNILHLPLVDYWVAELKRALIKQYPDFTFPERKFSFTPTYDIDLAFAYRQKGFFLQLAGYAKLLLKLDFKKIITRTKVLLRKEEDPFYTFDYLEDIHQKYQLRPCYFFLAAKRKSKYDRNPAWKNKAFQKLIADLSLSSDIGLHASYYTKEKPKRIKTEKDYLQSVTQKPVVRNRFHFLRFALPDGYRNLQDSNIKKDYSMGYADHICFRAGTCTPFFFFDIQKNKFTKLLIYPLLCMENAFSNCQNSEEIIQIITPYIEEIKKHNGTLTTLFHNHAFDEKEVGKKWKEVLEEVVKQVDGLGK